MYVLNFHKYCYNSKKGLGNRWFPVILDNDAELLVIENVFGFFKY